MMTTCCPSILDCHSDTWSSRQTYLSSSSILVILGIILAVGATLILCEIVQSSPIMGWSMLVAGSLSLMLGASLECANKNVSSKTQYLFLARRVGRSQEGCRGNISVDRADAILQKLQKKTSIVGISFDPTIYHQCPSIIGTCTAMSLEFAATYFRLRAELRELDPDHEQFLQRMRLLGENFMISSEEMRSRQAVFSSITIDRKVDMDISRNKIISWIKYHDFETDHYTCELKITENRDKLQQEIDKLPNGVYFVRMIMPADNHKLEARGHSMIYIQEKNVRFFYDNNCGLEKMPSSISLSFRLFSVHHTWDIPMVQLHRLIKIA